MSEIPNTLCGNLPPQDIVDKRFEEWWQAMELSHIMLMAGLKKRTGPDGELAESYRAWYRQHQARKWEEIRSVQERRIRAKSNPEP